MSIYLICNLVMKIRHGLCGLKVEPLHWFTKRIRRELKTNNAILWSKQCCATKYCLFHSITLLVSEQDNRIIKLVRFGKERN